MVAPRWNKTQAKRPEDPFHRVLYFHKEVLSLQPMSRCDYISRLERLFKTKKNHPRSESNPGFQSAREMFARFSRGFIHAPGIHPYGIGGMACMCMLNK